jgi:hypothetical protein
MAVSDWEHELREKLKFLAGGDADWLLDASGALDNASQTFKKLILEATGDGEARRLVDKLIERAGVIGRGQGACMVGRV